MTRYSSQMRVAHAKGLTLEDYLTRVSHLEHQMWEVWLARQWNEPSRGDWYTMALTAEVRRFRYGFSKSPPAVHVHQMKLPFTTRQTTPDEEDESDEQP